MMELLKRFEEDAANDDEALLEDGDSDAEDDDLASQLESMDLGRSQVHLLALHVLTLLHRERLV